MLKGWQFSNKISKIKKEECQPQMGFCYAVKFNVMPNFCLVKIGATRCGKERWYNMQRGKIYCLSPPHINFYENEEILHKHFQEFRVPRKPKGKSQVELFNIDLPYFFDNLPQLNYEVIQKKETK